MDRELECLHREAALDHLVDFEGHDPQKRIVCESVLSILVTVPRKTVSSEFTGFEFA